MNKKIDKAAKILFNSRIQLKQILKLPIDCTPQNKEEAYAIQNSLVKKYLAVDNNAIVIGKKIGCTNKAAQEQINITEPFYGNIFSNYASKSNCSIDIKNFIGPFVEPEFSFKIKGKLDILKSSYSFEKILKSIDSVLPSIEIVDSRFENWTIAGINNLIADNGANAYWIYGDEKKDLDTFDFTDHSVKLYINDIIVEKGNSSYVLGNPINSITWLINTLAYQNKTLPKDSYISTGTCTRAIPVKKGDKIFADFGNLGTIKFTLT